MKKKIPYKILEALQNDKTENLELVTVVNDSRAIVSLADKDVESDFFFKISNADAIQGVSHYLVSFKPADLSRLKAVSSTLDLTATIQFLNQWLGILKQYNSINTIYDDPIFVENKKRFEEQFIILDQDADIVGFELSQQLFLDEYLKNVKSKIIKLQAGKSRNDIKELNYISLEAESIRQVLTIESKNKIIKRLSKLWAMAQKSGLDVIKEIFVNVTADLIKKLITG